VQLGGVLMVSKKKRFGDDEIPIFNDACIAFIEPLKPATTATTYVGRFQMTSAAA
jgi:hypothetical protein